MEYTQDQWVEILTAIGNIDDHAAVFFIGSINDSHDAIEFNFVSRLENDEDTISVVQSLAKYVEQKQSPDTIVSAKKNETPHLKVVED
jgi:hypothetical protein